MNTLINVPEMRDVPESEPEAETKVDHPAFRTLGDLMQSAPDDSLELIAHRFLCRNGSLMLIGPTGAGKSAMGIQLAALWAIGKPCFGMRPTGELRSVIVQAENDEGDIRETGKGIFNGCRLTKSEQDRACQGVTISTINDTTGLPFIGKVTALLAECKPDVLFIDPLLAYIGRDVSQQEVASQFLREWLTPAIAKANCAVVILHHPPKPRQESGNEKSTDDAYYGAGSAELFNWSRAVVVLKPTRAHGVYELKLAKRGRRAGWFEADGQTPCYRRTIGHGENGLIYWRELDEQEAAKGSATPGKAKEDVLALVPMTAPIEKHALVSKAQAKGIGRNKATGFIAELLDAELLYLWRTKRTGTNPLQSLSRNPQPVTQ